MEQHMRAADLGARLTRISPRPRSRHCFKASNSNSAPSPAPSQPEGPLIGRQASLGR